MEKLIIQGGNRLEGRVRVSSAKNAVLPIIAGTLLASTPSKLLEIPNLEDVGTICQVIESLGVKITRNNADGEIVFDASTLTATEAPYELVRKMRASFLVMGPLLARKGEAKISMPGGCERRQQYPHEPLFGRFRGLPHECRRVYADGRVEIRNPGGQHRAQPGVRDDEGIVPAHVAAGGARGHVQRARTVGTQLPEPARGLGLRQEG